MGQSRALTEPNNGIQESCYPQVLKLKGKGECSGVLIAPNKILTAGHCQSLHLVEHNNQTLKVSAVHAHPKSRFQCTPTVSSTVHAHDLSILELETPINDIKPVRLGQAKATDLGRVVGFGQISESRPSTSGAKRSYSAVIDELVEEGRVLRHGTIDGIGACYGDSGGGLFRLDSDCNEPELVGILSFKSGVCGNGYVGFANLDHPDNLAFVEAVKHNQPVPEMSEKPECCAQGEAPPCFDETQIGACRAGKVQCLPTTGRFGKCVLEQPKAELCGNKIDDDCDGSTDEGCNGFSPLGSSEECAAPCSIYEPLMCRPFSLEAGGYRCECQGKKACASDEICSVVSSTCEPETGSEIPRICGCLSPGTPQQRCRVDYNDALPPCATEGNDCAELCRTTPLSADVLPPPPPPPPPAPGGSSTCTLDGICSEGETCGCDVFCCRKGSLQCTWSGDPKISYEECFACGFHSDGEVCWMDGLSQ